MGRPKKRDEFGHNQKKRSGENMGRSQQLRERWAKVREERAAYMPHHPPDKPTDEMEKCSLPGCDEWHYKRSVRGGD